MKHIILVLLVLVTALTAFGQEQKLTAAQKRKLERQQAEAARALLVEQAVEQGSFYYAGRDMQLRNMDRVMLRAPYDFVEVRPGELTVSLPYFTDQHTMNRTWPLLDFTTKEFTYTATEHKGNFTVKIEAKNVVDRHTVGRANQSRDYELIFLIGGDGSNTMLTIVPNFTGPVTYSGSISL